jgi:hypothetical protein
MMNKRLDYIFWDILHIYAVGVKNEKTLEISATVMYNGFVANEAFATRTRMCARK